MTKNQTEIYIQANCVKWLWNNHPETRGLFFEINNNPVNKIDGSRRKSAGMVAGVADTCMLWKGKAYFIEFKCDKGRQSRAQKAWEATAAKAGFNYFIIRDLCSFKELIHNILEYGTSD